MSNGLKITLAIVLLAALAFTAYSAAPYLKKFTFNEDNALDKWGKMILNGPVEYRLMRYGNNGFVEAISENACSALYYRLRFSVSDYPLLSWRWRVLKFPDKSKAATDKERDDYAARVYVVFPSWNFMNIKSIEYIWDENLPEGTIFASPYFGNIKLIVAESGRKNIGKWTFEERDIYEDYKKR